MPPTRVSRGCRTPTCGSRVRPTPCAMVRSCWGSLYSVESISYRRQRGIPEHNVAMAVVVQTMVDARSAGVMFTRSPTTGDRSVITIEGAWGLGSAVVGGEVTPDRWVIGKITGEISARAISDKAIHHMRRASRRHRDAARADELRRAACMSDEELQRAAGYRPARSSATTGAPQDIEWAVERAQRCRFCCCRAGPRRSGRPRTPHRSHAPLTIRRCM